MGCLEPPPPQHYSDERRVAAIPEKKSPEMPLVPLLMQPV